MTAYEKPIIEIEAVEVTDVILASGEQSIIKDKGQGALGTVEGDKGAAEFDFDSIFR